MLTLCFVYNQKTAYEMRISDVSSDVCSSDLTSPEQDAIQLVSIRETIMAMADFLRCTAGPSIDLHIDVGRELPPLICSRRDLENVILNLVASARDAMPSGGELGISAQVDRKSTRLNSSH